VYTFSQQFAEIPTEKSSKQENMSRYLQVIGVFGVDDDAGVSEGSAGSVPVEFVNGSQHGTGNNVCRVTQVSSAQNRKGDGLVVILAGFSKAHYHHSAQQLQTHNNVAHFSLNIRKRVTVIYY
jgi:hypothetical protein